MKVTKNQPIAEKRALVAVLHRGGLYLSCPDFSSETRKDDQSLSCRVGLDGKLSRPWFNPLQVILNSNPEEATPIYEGDSITIQF